jgi:uncharacterized protein YggT (Ycf19 family)
MGIFLSYLYTLCAFAALLLVGQGAVYILSFGRHETNAVYSFMSLLTSPVTKLVRRITPAKVADRHVPVVAFFLLFWICVLFAVFLPSVVGKA